MLQAFDHCILFCTFTEENNEKILYSLGSDYYNKCPREKSSCIHVLNAACLENE